jgi:hypothetical protein
VGGKSKVISTWGSTLYTRSVYIDIPLFRSHPSSACTMRASTAPSAPHCHRISAITRRHSLPVSADRSSGAVPLSRSSESLRVIFPRPCPRVKVGPVCCLTLVVPSKSSWPGSSWFDSSTPSRGCRSSCWSFSVFILAAVRPLISSVTLAVTETRAWLITCRQMDKLKGSIGKLRSSYGCL